MWHGITFLQEPREPVEYNRFTNRSSAAKPWSKKKKDRYVIFKAYGTENT